jgi:enoyl-CoA hydratase/carnithine racemase
MTDVIKTARDGAAATITIDRVADGNMLTIAMQREFMAALRAIARAIFSPACCLRRGDE